MLDRTARRAWQGVQGRPAPEDVLNCSCLGTYLACTACMACSVCGALGRAQPLGPAALAVVTVCRVRSHCPQPSRRRPAGQQVSRSSRFQEQAAVRTRARGGDAGGVSGPADLVTGIGRVADCRIEGAQGSSGQKVGWGRAPQWGRRRWGWRCHGCRGRA